MQKMIYHLGVDIGSTTIKFVVLDEKERIIFKDYFRHLSDPSTAFLQEIQKILAIIDGREFSLILTGSAGFGFAERMGVPHVQEVIACRAALRSLLPEAETAVELGGEDAKITWLGSSPEQRMNGVCAGGTGSFIDQAQARLSTIWRRFWVLTLPDLAVWQKVASVFIRSPHAVVFLLKLMCRP